MAKLDAAHRNSLPTSDFAGPDRSYPIPDRSHGANAKARAAQQVASGRMPKSEEERIDAKVDRKFGFPRGKTAHHNPHDRLAHA